MAKKLLPREKEMLGKGYISARMAAFKTGIHRATFRLHMRQGVLPYLQNGGTRFIKITDFAAYLGEAANSYDLTTWDLC